MANSANPEINKKIATSALGTLVIATVFFYLGDRYAETLVTYPGQIFDHLSDAFLSMWQTIKDAPFALDMTSNSLLFGGACFLIIWMIWLRYVAFIGNYRSGEESGSARWGTVKEGKKFKDLRFFVEPSRDEETDFLEFHLVRLMLAGTFLLDIRHLALGLLRARHERVRCGLVSHCSSPLRSEPNLQAAQSGRPHGSSGRTPPRTHRLLRHARGQRRGESSR